MIFPQSEFTVECVTVVTIFFLSHCNCDDIQAIWL